MQTFVWWIAGVSISEFFYIEKIMDFFPKKSEILVEFTLAKIPKTPHFFEKLTNFFSKITGDNLMKLY
jgi:hypothetical protein